MNCAETLLPSLPAALPANACFAIVAPAGAARLDTHKVSQWFADRGYSCRLYPAVNQAQATWQAPTSSACKTCTMPLPIRPSTPSCACAVVTAVCACSTGWILT